MKPVKRVLEYRKALWLTENAPDLQSVVIAAWAALPSMEQRIVLRKDDTSVVGMPLQDRAGSALFQGCKYIDGQPVGIVPKRGGRSPKLSEQPPGPGQNFLSADFFVLVSGNDLITLNAGMNAAYVKSYLHGLFPVAGLPQERTMFDLVQQAAPDVLRKIQSAGGVASIQFDVGITEATASLIKDENSSGSMVDRLRYGVGSLLDLISKPRGRHEILDSSGSMRLQLNLPKGELQAVQQAATRLAVDLVDDYRADDFVIRLRNGEAIRRGSMSSRKIVSVRRASNSFVADDVFSEMVAFLSEVRASGLTEV